MGKMSFYDTGKIRYWNCKYERKGKCPGWNLAVFLRIRDFGFLLQYPNVVEVDSDKDTVKRAHRLWKLFFECVPEMKEKQE